MERRMVFKFLCRKKLAVDGGVSDTESVAGVAMFGSTFVINSYLIYGMHYRDSNGFQKILHAPTDETLGAAIQEALLNSRALARKEAESVLSREAAKENQDMWVQQVLLEVGAHSRHDLFSGMAKCMLVRRNDVLRISGMRHDRGEGFEGIGSENDVCVEGGVTAEEVGLATRQVLALAVG